jgi:asparagine synthetase B (glutamine-hydrolysing)
VESEYWSASELYSSAIVRPAREAIRAMPEGQLLERLESELSESFQYRLVSDVPVGLLLSGGIDSSIVAALLARVPGTTQTVGPQVATVPPAATHGEDGRTEQLERMNRKIDHSIGQRMRLKPLCSAFHPSAARAVSF